MKNVGFNIPVVVAHRKQEILGAPDLLVGSGKRYYVSETGNDTNDGLSPESAWATLEHVNRANHLRTGDVVLFRRGDLFRGILQTKSGVGYGAYGSGPKPRICGSLWNAAELHWETTDILHVYRCEGIYDRDAGLLIGDDGKLVGIKKLGGIEELQNDGDFFHAPDRHVYMRWSQGNPAECFKEIEIGINLHTVQLLNGQENITIENLNVCYTGAHGIAGGYCKNIVIRFCEFHWIGGSIQAGTVRYGNAVEFWASSDTVLVEHCYVSQVYDAGITHQAGGAKQVQMRHITYRYNLVEYCTFSFECYVRRRNKDGKILIDPECYMEDILIENNLTLYAGFGLGEQRPDKNTPAHIKTWESENFAKNSIIRDNIFYQSRVNLFQIDAIEPQYYPELRHNTYIQVKGRPFGVWNKESVCQCEDTAHEMRDRGIDVDPIVIWEEEAI